MEERAANSHDITNCTLQMNTSKLSIYLPIAWTLNAIKFFLMSNFSAISELLLEAVLQFHVAKKCWREIKINHYLDDRAQRECDDLKSSIFSMTTFCSCEFGERDESHAAEYGVEQKIFGKQNLLTSSKYVTWKRKIESKTRHEGHPNLAAKVCAKWSQVDEIW